MALALKLKFKPAQLNKAKRRTETIAQKSARLAVNETLTKVKITAIKEVAKNLRISQQLVRNRYSSVRRNGKLVKTGERLRITKANFSTLQGRIKVHLRGVPISTFAGGQVKAARAGSKAAASRNSTRFGVKGKGGRFYAGAFKDRQGRVWKRRSDGQLMVPKLGLREDLIDEMDELVLSGKAQRTFQARFNRIMAYQIQRANARG
jgi:hypothetical protein